LPFGNLRMATASTLRCLLGQRWNLSDLAGVGRIKARRPLFSATAIATCLWVMLTPTWASEDTYQTIVCAGVYVTIYRTIADCSFSSISLEVFNAKSKSNWDEIQKSLQPLCRFNGSRLTELQISELKERIDVFNSYSEKARASVNRCDLEDVLEEQKQQIDWAGRAWNYVLAARREVSQSTKQFITNFYSNLLGGDDPNAETIAKAAAKALMGDTANGPLQTYLDNQNNMPGFPPISACTNPTTCAASLRAPIPPTPPSAQ
jgi:hypothetical protein